LEEKTITVPQIHFRGIPGPGDDPHIPGSIIEYSSTSLKVVLLQCWSENDRDYPINSHEFFKVDDHIVDKTKNKFYYLGKRDFENNFQIKNWNNVKILVPKSSTELHGYGNVLLAVWPPIFVCEDCGRIFRPNSEDYRKIRDANSFPLCHTAGCEGEYWQSPQILQCRICGSIRHLPTSCVKCGSPLHLRKGSIVDIETWRFECTGSPPHITNFSEYHEYWCQNDDGIISNTLHEERASSKNSKREPMTTVGRGIATPLIYRFPIAEEDPRLSDEERRLIASQSHILTIEKYISINAAKNRFNKNDSLWNKESQRLFFETGNKPTDQDVINALNYLPADGMEGYPNYGLFKLIQQLCKNKIIKSFDLSKNCEFEKLDKRVEEWSDLLSGRNYFTKRPNNLIDLIKISEKPDKFLNIQKNLHFKQIRYIDRIAVITGTYGLIRGSIHPISSKGQELDPIKIPLTKIAYGYDQSKKPKYVENGRTEFPVIITKRQTEGILFTLKAQKLLNIISKKLPSLWIKLTNENQRESSNYSEEEARIWLMYASYNKDYGEEIRKITYQIVHTISHAIIHRFARVSGLRDEDLSEMLFPEFGGFVIYNGLMNPLGMLRRVFEETLDQLVNEELIQDMVECDMDPACFNQEEGAACHACLHTAEHVCEKFNLDLDRRILIGNDGFWR
jgi:hypothetical protein